MRKRSETMAQLGGRRSKELRSKAEAIAFPLMGGRRRKKDAQLSPIEYIGLGCELRGELNRRMTAAGLEPRDATIYLVANDSNLLEPSSYTQLTGGSRRNMGANELFVMFEYADENSKYQIIGLIVAIHDKEKSQWLVFARSFYAASNEIVERQLEHTVAEIRLKKSAEELARSRVKS